MRRSTKSWGLAVSLPPGAAGPLVPGSASTSRCPRVAGMGAGSAALGALSCGIRQPIARNAGMKREGWRSMHWRGDRADWGRLLGHFCPTRMDTKCARGCRQGRGWCWQQAGLARPCPSASAVFSAGGYDPSEGCWQLGSQTCPPKPLKPLQSTGATGSDSPRHQGGL